ncbi:MAG TPA: tRNA (adenosine(37)-N6)-threonylcarbamoyltransferase complex dimerization subunit type 1 TsaB [Bacillota bacterium]|nr:tRNA (adenosine(37)-N6)-threonylcarbamoyltransferase complex dimerization subunit type 1 TsaB [Bacillota bacterium]
MRVLALESSSLVAGIAVLDGSSLVYEGYSHHKRNHSQTLMPMIEYALATSEIELADIDIIAVTNGPGSFTGLRIGISTVKGLAQASDKRVVAIPTLDSLAHNVTRFPGLVCPIMDARREQVYTCIYKWQNTGYKKLMSYSAMHIHELVEEILDLGQPVIFLGDGVAKYKDLLKERLGGQMDIAPAHLCLQRASTTAWMAQNYASSNRPITYYELEPFYLRKSQAEQAKSD